MDSEDRDHFKTIAQATAPESSQSKSSAENSTSVQFHAYCMRQTKILFGCYRRDDSADPDIYCAAVASTLALFPRQVVDYVTDPRTGIASENKFLPNVAEVRAACSAAGARLALQSKPSIPRRAFTGVPINLVNLFVPVGFPGYDKMIERAATEAPDLHRYQNGYTCYDGMPRNGIWVPYKWHDERNSWKAPVEA